MKSTTRGLLLEQWRQSRGLLAAAAVLLAVCTGVTVLFYDSVLHHLFPGGAEGALVPAWLAVLVAFASLFVHGTARDIRMTFPRRLFTLPVRTATLVTIPFVYKLAVISVFALALGTISYAVFPNPYPIWFPLVLFLVATAWVQAYVCLVTASGFARATGLFIVLLIGFSALFVLPAQVLFHKGLPWQHWTRYFPLSRDWQFAFAGVSLLVATVWAASCARLVRRLPGTRILALAAPLAVGVFILLMAAWIFLLVAEAVSLHVAFLGICPLAVLLRRFSPTRSAVTFVLCTAVVFICCETAFLWLAPDECMGVLITTGLVVSAWVVSVAAISTARHGDHALVWKDTRRTRHTLWARLEAFRASPLAAQARFEWRNTARYLPLLTCVGLLLALGACMLLRARGSWAVAFVFGTSLPAALACGVGFYLERCSKPYLAFAATRPLSVRTLAHAKILAGGMAVAASLAPVAVIWMLGIALVGDGLREMSQMQGMTLLSLIVTNVFGIWAGMMLGRLLLALLVSMYAALLAALPLAWAGDALLNAPRHDNIGLEEAMGAVLTGAVIAALFAINAVLRSRRFPSRRILLPAILVFLAGACGAHWLASSVCPHSGDYRPTDFYDFYLIPVMPFLALLVLYSAAEARGLMSLRQTILSLLAYLAVVGAVFWLLKSPGQAPYDWEYLFTVGLGLAVLWAPFVWMPLIIDWQRHR